MADFTPASPQGRFGPTTVELGPCAICHDLVKGGDIPTIVNAVPADAEEQAKADAGRAYNARCDMAHQSCAYPKDGA